MDNQSRPAPGKTAADFRVETPLERTSGRTSGPAIASAARQAGAIIVEECAVRGFETSNGKISTIITEHGRIDTSAVVCAVGMWSRLLCGSAGVDFPQLYFLMSMGCTRPVDNGPGGCGGRTEWAWCRQLDSGYSLGRLLGQRAPVTRDSLKLFFRFLPALKMEWSTLRLEWGYDMLKDWQIPRSWSLDKTNPFEKYRIFDPNVDPEPSRKSLELLATEFPVFRQASSRETWAGAVVATPDNMPVASEVDKPAGLYIISGASYGITWAPALAGIITDKITGSNCSIDSRPFRFSRFHDGTPLEPAP